MPSTGRFNGNCAELSGYIFDWSDYRQTDKYVTNMKRTAEYLGAMYKQGGDIRSTIENKLALQIPISAEPRVIGAAIALSTAQTLTFKGEINKYIMRRATLEENMQKAYSLIVGQYIELLRAKFKQSNDWVHVSTVFDVLGLIRLVKTIVFKFNDQKFLPVSLHQPAELLQLESRYNDQCGIP
jgi:hypothetical protein